MSSGQQSKHSQGTYHLSDSEDEKNGRHEELMNLIRTDVTTIKQMTNFLSAHKIDINYQNKNGDNFLHVAVRKCRPEIVQLLIGKGADVTLSNNSNKIPLQLVIERLTTNKPETLRELRSIEESLRDAQPGTSAMATMAMAKKVKRSITDISDKDRKESSSSNQSVQLPSSSISDLNYLKMLMQM